MKICQPHWDALRKAIDDRGLSGLVAGDGHKAHAAMVREIEGRSEPGDWDPLMAANWSIHSRALECGGLYLLASDENGRQYCPLCEAEKHGGAGCAQEWIDGCSNAMLEHARENHLIPDIQ